MAVLRLVPSQGAPTPLEITLDRVVVGREPTCDVVVSDGSVSRKHAILERRGMDWAVVDQGSANGTFIDSQRVTDQVLHNGQELRFGSMAYRVQLEGEDEGATILTSLPDATMVQDSPLKPAAAAPPKPAAPPWSPPPGAPVVAPAPPLPKEPAAVRPPALPAKPVPAIPPRPPATPPVPPPLPPRAAVSRPAGVTPANDGAPPAPGKKRGPLFWAGGGCCGCLVLVLVFVGVIGGGAYFMTSAAVEAVKAQIADIKKGDMPAAYARMTSAYRAQHSLEDFTAFVEKHPALKQNTDTTFSSRNVKNDTATLGGSLSGAQATKEEVTYTLQKEGGTWRIGTIAFSDGSSDDAAGGSTSLDFGASGAATGGSLTLATISADKSESPPAGYAIAIKVRATGFGTDGPADAPRADLVLDLETLGPGGRKLPDLSRMELQSRDRPDSLQPPSVDFDVNVTLRDATPGNYVARLTVRDQIGRDIKTQDVPFTLP